MRFAAAAGLGVTIFSSRYVGAFQLCPLGRLAMKTPSRRRSTAVAAAGAKLTVAERIYKLAGKEFDIGKPSALAKVWLNAAVKQKTRKRVHDSLPPSHNAEFHVLL